MQQLLQTRDYSLGELYHSTGYTIYDYTGWGRGRGTDKKKKKFVVSFSCSRYHKPEEPGNEATSIPALIYSRS